MLFEVVNEVLMNETVCKSEHFQRVYQYLKRRDAHTDLSKFKSTREPEGDPPDILAKLTRYTYYITLCNLRVTIG